MPFGTSAEQQVAIINKNFATLDNEVATSTFKVVDTVTVPISISSGGTPTGGSITASHGQNYEPLMFVTIDITSGSGGIEEGIFPFPYLNISVASPNPIINTSVTIASLTDSEITFLYAMAAGCTLEGTITLRVLQITAI